MQKPVDSSYTVFKALHRCKDDQTEMHQRAKMNNGHAEDTLYTFLLVKESSVNLAGSVMRVDEERVHHQSAVGRQRQQGCNGYLPRETC